MLHTPDGRPRCAIVTTAHLSDQERQFATTLIPVSYTHLRAHETVLDLVCRLLLENTTGPKAHLQHH